jgi:hypothetical membrane protein
MDATPQTPSRLSLLLGGGTWILTLLYFVAQAVAQAAWQTSYSLIDNRVSDLGNTACGPTLANTYICSPLHAVMNTTFVLTGVLILVGLFLTRSMWPRRRLTTWGLILLGVAGAGTILVGLSPENVNVLVHIIGAINIPAGNAAMILLGLAVRRGSRGASAASGAIQLARFSLLSGVIGFLGLVAGPFLVMATGHGGGLAERIALYPLIIWLIVFGVWVVSHYATRKPVEVHPVAKQPEPVGRQASVR